MKKQIQELLDDHNVQRSRTALLRQAPWLTHVFLQQIRETIAFQLEHIRKIVN